MKEYNWQSLRGDMHSSPSANENTKLYDLGLARVVSTTEKKFRIVLVEKKQTPFPGSKSKKKTIRYAIIENFLFSMRPAEVYEFYHGRQTIEQFFKESNDPFNAGKMPSQLFRANEAYLQLVVIAENCCLWFKKKFCLPVCKAILWKPSEIN